jgi:hypothetical protein
VPQPAGPDFRPPNVAALQQHAALQQIQMQQAQQNQSLAQYSQQAQYNAQQMNAQNFYQHNALLGAQNLIDAELWCNCVPSRSQVWATSDPE